MRTLLLIVALCAVAFGSEIDGQWKSTVNGDRGKSFEEALDLKADGAKLAGTFSRGKDDRNSLEDGWFEGGKVKFYVTMVAANGDHARCQFKGEMKGGELWLEISIPNGPVFARVFRRAR